ncbi:MAG: lipopolysaccharide biosynthesis protein [Acidobacteria bacterium]|nr:MAG: lipopolysaccharide biosynthesis protein [Acidobacteriota bacterium]
MASQKSNLTIDHFGTEHLKKNLGGRAARGGLVAITAQALKFVITLGATAVMARLLTPQDYGFVGMVGVVTGFVATYKDLGLSAATIQSPKITSDQISTLFWINVLLSIGIAVLTIGLAPFISWFYGEPRLTWITILTGFGFIINGFAVQHEALLRRQMRYFALSTIGLVAMVVGYIIGISMAWKGFSYFALVGSQLAVAFTSTLITWAVVRWKPGPPKKGTGVRSMLKLGGNLTGFATINYFARNGDNLLIGRFWGAEQVGIYSRAYQLMMLPIDQINEPVTTVAVPSLSRLVDSPEDYRRAYLRMIEKIAFLTMPSVAAMIVTSDWLVSIVLGPKWASVATILQLLGATALIQPIANTTGWLFITQGRTDEMFKMSLWGGPITILSIIVGIPWGAVGVATSYTIAHVCGTPILYWYIGRRGPVRAGDFYRRTVPLLGATLFGMLMALAFRWWNPSIGKWVGIPVCVAILLATFLISLLLLPSGRASLKDVAASFFLLRK